MRRAVWLLSALALLAGGSENPIGRLWLLNRSAQTASPVLRAVLPDVHSVRVDDHFVYVESAGLSLQSLGALEANDREPAPMPRAFTFRLPLRPRKSEAPDAFAPVDLAGVFLNGVPLFSPSSPASFRDQNLWHWDSTARLLRAGQPETPLLRALLTPSGRHSPLIGFALDGFPIYGPFGWDEHGGVRHFRSSYKPRQLSDRASLATGATPLTPAQEGPPPNHDYPLGSFVEDYEYVAASGDLDRHNGRLAKTPEYPEGTYAYFLSTTPRGDPEYPYLVGPSYYGRIDDVSAAIGAKHVWLDGKLPVTLSTPADLQAGRPCVFRLSIVDARGTPIRSLEKVHEQPIHLVVVSEDFADFAHIHPVPQPRGDYAVSYVFPRPGAYWLYAEFTRPGAAQSVARFQVGVGGTPATPAPVSEASLKVKLTAPEPARAGADLTLRFDVADAKSAAAVDDLEPYLAAWAHIAIVSQDHRDFIHVHPLEAVAVQHTHAAAGPSPSSVTAITGFRHPGLYHLWIQLQRHGVVNAFPFTLRVTPGHTAPLPATMVPAGAIRVRVSAEGFTPARIRIPAGRPATLAFHRTDAQNCASSVVFPELSIRAPLPPGQTTLVPIPAGSARDLTFTCGMAMYRGSLLVR